MNFNLTVHYESCVKILKTYDNEVNEKIAVKSVQ